MDGYPVCFFSDGIVIPPNKKVRSGCCAPKNAQLPLLPHKFQQSFRGCQNRACVFTRVNTSSERNYKLVWQFVFYQSWDENATVFLRKNKKPPGGRFRENLRNGLPRPVCPKGLVLRRGLVSQWRRGRFFALRGALWSGDAGRSSAFGADKSDPYGELR